MMEQVATQTLPTPEELGKMPDHTSKADLELMASAIRKLTGAGRQFFAAEVIASGLMKLNFEGIEASEEEIDRAHSLLREDKDQDRIRHIANTMFQMVEGSLDDLIDVTAGWCVEGVDTVDENSAGGWSREELLTAYALLYVARNGLTIPFGSNVQ